MKTRLMNHFESMKMHQKLILVYLTITLLPILIISLFFTGNMIKNITQQNFKESQIAFDQLVSNLESELSQYSITSDNILSEEMIIKHLTNKADDGIVKQYSDYVAINRLYNSLFMLKDYNNTKIRFFSDNPDILYDSDFLTFIDDNVRASDWYTKLMASENSKYITDPYKNRYNEPVFLIARTFSSESAPDITNIFYFEIKTKSLSRYISNESENKDIFIINSNNIVVTSTRKEAIGQDAASIDLLKETNTSVPPSDQKNGLTTDRSLIFYSPLQIDNYSSSWRIVSVLSTASFRHEMLTAILRWVLLSIGLIIISIVLILVFSYQFTYRIQLLIRNMSEIKDGNFSISVDMGANDEIGEIIRNFAQMVERTNKLISEVYLVQMEKQNLQLEKNMAEIHALESQSNPHFVFNTLEAIRMNLLIKGDRETAKVVEEYAILVRESINWQEDIIPLSKEIEFTKHFLNIEKFRYYDKVDYSFDIDESLLGCLVPKFSIQPVVQNAIDHGLEPKPDSGTVTVTARQEENALLIIVWDDGVGITEDELAGLEQAVYSEKPPEKSRIGLRNVHRRILLSCGPEYGITIQSKLGCGTAVTMKLPLQTVLPESKTCLKGAAPDV